MNRDVLHNQRISYNQGKLEIEDLRDDPINMMREWFQTALDLDIHDANAMTLATANKDGQPTARTVLLKEIDEEGYVFYTNYQSRKGQEILQNPKACLLFFWKELERQVRIEGTINKVSAEESKIYFQSRPKGSQLGAWASPQSKKIADRSTLEDRLEELQETYKDYDQLPLPAHWGGYLLIPHYYEFWQGRENRLHDRFEYSQGEDRGWLINRLAP